MSVSRIPMFVLIAVAGGLLSACGTTPPAPAKPAATSAARPEAPVTPAAAANMAVNCFACHGPNGVSPGSIPSLHSFTANNLSEMLKAFKTGQRPSTVMGRHAKGYTNTEIEAISAYIASLNRK